MYFYPVMKPEQEASRQTLIRQTMKGIDELAARTNHYMGRDPLTALPWDRATLKELGFTNTEIDTLGQEFELSR